MSKGTVFDPFGLLANPWYFINFGLQFMRSWQDAWLSRVTLGTSPVGSMFGLRVDVAPTVLPSTEMEIAARQGRDKPWLGCLTGVQVVGGPESVVPAPVEPTAERVIESPAPKAVATKVVAPKKKAAPSARPVEPVAAAPVAEPPREPAPEQAGDAAPSVTSMLAMQARSLSKAVSKAPKAEAAKPAAKGEGKKPAAKKAASKKA